MIFQHVRLADRAACRAVGLALFFVWASSVLLIEPAAAAALKQGDFLVVDRDQRAVFRVDPATGDRTIVSGGLSSTVGSGPLFQSPNSIAIDAHGSILVSNRFDSVYRVDPVTGNRTELSGPTRGAGGELLNPVGITMTQSGQLYLSDRGEALVDTVAVRKIDPVSGDRAVVSSKGVGDGPLFIGSGHIVEDEDGSILLTASASIYRTDPITGNRSVVSGSGVGMGPAMARDVTGIELKPTGGIFASGNLIVGDVATPSLYEVDAVTGNRRLMSGGVVGSGTTIRGAGAFAFVANSRVIMGQEQTRSLLLIDLVSGARTTFSAGDNSSLPKLGSGPNFSAPVDIAVYAIIPEPTSLALTTMLGVCGMMGRRRNS